MKEVQPTNEFEDQNLFSFEWHHEPEDWKIENEKLEIFTAAKTDFWQRTHYGFEVDNGHFLSTVITGDFVIETAVNCNFKHQYDQAGIMVRVSDQCWVKTSVEYEADKPNKLGVVVTNNGFSDWSTQNVSDSFTIFKLRITRKFSDFKVECFDEKLKEWFQLRLFHLFDNPKVAVGIYACSPNKKGFSARFNYLKIERK